MKKILIPLALLFVTGTAAAQKVAWSFSAKKLAGNKFELHLTATPPAGWHIYSQNTADGGPLPTEFTFNANPLVTIAGKPKEMGKAVQYYDKNFKVNVTYLEGKVDFVQVVTLKGKVKTNITGKVESMICNDNRCLPPTTENFSIALQ
ncbi:MAG: protein-disulfide reductase DsbD family protein [Ferruginibacter sp.]